MNLTKKDIEKLTNTEAKLWYKMAPQMGVLYLHGKPGVGKTQIVKQLADKLGFAYLDLRLSMLDETDVGLYPRPDSDVNYDDNGNAYYTFSYAVPSWALEANKKPTIIVFEELNRAPLSVRNAALQILLERRIAGSFQFNDNVFFVATGNLGEEDGTDVEEFDTALRNRLIYHPIEENTKEWLNWAEKANVNPLIRDYLYQNSDKIYSIEDAQKASGQFATPRSWEMLSAYLNYKLGDKANDPKSVKSEVNSVGMSYIGSAYHGFSVFLGNLKKITLQDVLNYNESGEKFKNKDIEKGYVFDLMEQVLSKHLCDYKTASKLTVKNIKSISNFVHDYAYEEHMQKMWEDLYNNIAKSEKINDLIFEMTEAIEISSDENIQDRADDSNISFDEAKQELVKQQKQEIDKIKKKCSSKDWELISLILSISGSSSNSESN
jgi:hypothetical protein